MRILCVLFIAVLAMPVTNELIGGVWSDSRLYRHALLSPDQQTARVVGSVQIVHDATFRKPIRLVRVSPEGGEPVVIFDRDSGSGWNLAAIASSFEQTETGLPAEALAQLVGSLENQVRLAQDNGAERAAEVVWDDPGPMLVWPQRSADDPAPDWLQNARPIVLQPGEQIWYPKLLVFAAVWFLLTGVAGMGVVRLTKRASIPVEPA